MFIRRCARFNIKYFLRYFSGKILALVNTSSICTFLGIFILYTVRNAVFRITSRLLKSLTVCEERNMGAYLGKGTYWQFFHKLDSRENSLSNAANHFKIFLTGFEICLYEHLYFLYIRNPLFPIVAFISIFWQLKVNIFYPKNSFPIV